MIIILDTNLWLKEQGLRSSLGAVTRFYLRQNHARLALPEVIRLEVEHNLRDQLGELVSKLQSTYRQLLVIFGTLKELVVPSTTDIEKRVAELFGKLGVEVLDIPLEIISDG